MVASDPGEVRVEGGLDVLRVSIEKGLANGGGESALRRVVAEGQPGEQLGGIEIAGPAELGLVELWRQQGLPGMQKPRAKVQQHGRREGLVVVDAGGSRYRVLRERAGKGL